MRKIFIVAGEPSGDLQASLLIKEIKRINPAVEFCGLGGKHMQAQGVDLRYDLASEAVVGFHDVVKKAFFFKKMLQNTVKEIKNSKPDCIILVDYPGFNLRLAKEAKKNNINTIYYISPQIWAWDQKRVYIVKKYVDKMLVLFEFEKKFYQNFGIEAEFTSHPLRDVVKTTMAKDDFLKKYNLSKTAKKIFLMPGSRKKEIEIHMPIIIKALSKIKLNHDIEPLLLLPKHAANLITHNNLAGFRIITDDAYNAMHHSDLGIVASGTATLEAALSGNPFVVIYKTSLINYLILKPLVKVPQIGMVNLIIGHEAMPELIQYKLTPQKLQNIVLKILNDADYYKGLKAELYNFKDRLGQENAAQKAAEYILDFLNKRQYDQIPI